MDTCQHSNNGLADTQHIGGSALSMVSNASALPSHPALLLTRPKLQHENQEHTSMAQAALTDPDPVALCDEAKGLQALLAQCEVLGVAWCWAGPALMRHLVDDDRPQCIREGAAGKAAATQRVEM